MSPPFNVHLHHRMDDDDYGGGGAPPSPYSSPSKSSSSSSTAAATISFPPRPMTTRIFGTAGPTGGGGMTSSSSARDDDDDRRRRGGKEEGDATRNNAATKDASTSQHPSSTSTSTFPSSTTTIPPKMICSPLPSEVANFLLRRRLLLSTLVIPIAILASTPLLFLTAASSYSLLTTVAGGGWGTSGMGGGGGGGGVGYRTVILLYDLSSYAIAILVAFVLHRTARDAIIRHAPNDRAKNDALSRSALSLPFWSLLIAIFIVGTMMRMLLPLFPSFVLGIVEDPTRTAAVMVGREGERTRRYREIVTRTIHVGGSCIGPALAWSALGMMVVLRYAGPFRPIVRCSATPLRTNPFDAALHSLGRNFTSRTRFLDMIANGLDMLSSPSSSTSSTSADGRPKSSSSAPSFFATTVAARNDVPPPPKGNDPTTNNINMAGRLNNGSLVRRMVTSSLLPPRYARYSRPVLSSILVQSMINAAGGHILARAYVLPHVGRIFAAASTNHEIIALSCLLVPIFELLFTSMNESELNYRHYHNPILLGNVTQVGDDARGGSRRQFRSWPVLVVLFGDAMHRARRTILGPTMMAPPPVATVTVFLWRSFSGSFLVIPSERDGSFLPHSYHWTSVATSLFVSYAIVAVLASIMAVQDVLTRWTACAGLDVDVLMSRFHSTIATSSDDDDAFLAEDLIIQSVLMGDGITVDAVISAPNATRSRTSAVLPRSVSNNQQEDEILRNEMATASFSGWIEKASTTASGQLSDDILRMCILESLGGGGSASGSSSPYYFGTTRHSVAVRKRLDLSAATASPGRQPIAVPVVRALCAFAGGVGDAMSLFYRTSDGDGRPPREEGGRSGELWKLPPGSLHAAEFSIIAAARLVVMNSVVVDGRGRFMVNSSKRHDRLSLLLPCVLQSAYKLHCGINKYAEATAASCGLDLSTYGRTGGKEGGLGCFIVAECPDLCPVISACKDSAKMAMNTLLASGDRSFEDLLSRRKWKGDVQQWLVGL